MFVLDAPVFALDYVRRIAPKDLRIDSVLQADMPQSESFVIVSTSPAYAVSNGKMEDGSEFTLVISSYSSERARAHETSHLLFERIVKAWRAGIVTEHGWISRIRNTGQHPYPVDSNLEADDFFRFDFTLEIIARH